MSHTKMSSARYIVTFVVNNEVTCIAENLHANEVYNCGVPSEALLQIVGNRWHALTNDFVLTKMAGMYPGEMILLAFQSEPVNPGLDTEAIYVTKGYKY